VLLLIASAGGCAYSDYHYGEATYDSPIQGRTVLQSIQIDPALEENILALDPEHITENDIKDLLSRGPTPRIVNVYGGIPPVYYVMKSFAEFLIGMGYPEGKVRNPGDGTYAYSPYKSSEKIAGLVAWYYEKEGMPPMLIGHSLGGIQTVKVLHELAGTFSDRLAVWNPLSEEAEERYAIIDPVTGIERPVIGVRLGYASAVGSGGLGRFFPNMWSMAGKLRTIPDTVEHFTGFFIGLDFLGGDLFGLAAGPNTYKPNGAAKVRNVRLPAWYNHVMVPTTGHLATDQATRDWINAYVPTDDPALTVALEAPGSNILWAADVWHSVKKQWCLEAQRLIRAKRSLGVAP
jgi:hypothetical protein